jgi:hypothetical protein
VLFVMWYDSPDAQNLTDAFARRIVATVKRQMAPEFHVMGETDRLEKGVAFYFFITPLQGPPPRKHSSPRHGIGGGPPAGTIRAPAPR